MFLVGRHMSELVVAQAHFWDYILFIIGVIQVLPFSKNKYICKCLQYHLEQATFCQKITRFFQLNQNRAEDCSMIHVLLTSNWSGYQIRCVTHIFFDWFLSYRCFSIKVVWQHFGLQKVNCSIQNTKVSDQFRFKRRKIFVSWLAPTRILISKPFFIIIFRPKNCSLR